MSWLLLFLKGYWLQIAIVAAITGFGLYFAAHERNVQYDKDQKVLKLVTAERDAANANASRWQAALTTFQDAQASRQRQDQQARQDAQKALQEQRRIAQQRESTLQSRIDTYRRQQAQACSTQDSVPLCGGAQ